MSIPAASLLTSHKRFFFDKFGITERLLERCLGEALSAGGDYADLYFESVMATRSRISAFHSLSGCKLIITLGFPSCP